MKFPWLAAFILFMLLPAACSKSDNLPKPPGDEEEPSGTTFLRGADLSYVNEMLDCGAIYYNQDGIQENPFLLFADAGADLVRVRLWHQPDWTSYSDLEDVKKTIASAKEQGMQVMLDFHYSDDWADPGKQKVPAAWLPVVNDTDVLSDSLYNYTTMVLGGLQSVGLMPDFVQVGNEINSEILQDPNQEYTSINWSRNARLIKRGIQAVRDVSSQFDLDIQVVLHIAQPENALWWFDEASSAGIIDFDWIGISYYPAWSSYSLAALSGAIRTLTRTYAKRLMVVETAYPFTLTDVDGANNILGSSALINGFPATEQGQYDYLLALEKSISDGGGEGLIYWEPAWVSTSCRTQWSQGSHWDNATLFNRDHLPNLGMEYYNTR